MAPVTAWHRMPYGTDDSDDNGRSHDSSPFSDEPYASMSARLVPDDPAVDRREYFDLGQGLLLRELTKLQESSLGSCKCAGRPT